MEIKNFNESHVSYINYLLDFLVARASGIVPTGARFIRDLIQDTHCESYKHDSILDNCTLTYVTETLINLSDETANLEVHSCRKNSS